MLDVVPPSPSRWTSSPSGASSLFQQSDIKSWLWAELNQKLRRTLDAMRRTKTPNRSRNASPSPGRTLAHSQCGLTGSRRFSAGSGSADSGSGMLPGRILPRQSQQASRGCNSGSERVPHAPGRAGPVRIRVRSPSYPSGPGPVLPLTLKLDIRLKGK